MKLGWVWARARPTVFTYGVSFIGLLIASSPNKIFKRDARKVRFSLHRLAGFLKMGLSFQDTVIHPVTASAREGQCLCPAVAGFDPEEAHRDQKYGICNSRKFENNLLLSLRNRDRV